MILLLYVLYFILLTSGLYRLMEVILRMPAHGSARALCSARGERSWAQGVEDRGVLPLARLIGRAICLPKQRRQRLLDDLERIGIDMTPEVYVGRMVVFALMMVLVGVPFALLVAPWAMAVFVVLGVMLLLRAGADEHQKIEELNRRIEGELPRMIEVMIFTMRRNRDMVQFFERYLLVTGPELKPEIERLLFNMKSGNTIMALTQFKARVRLYTVGEFVAACIGIVQGLDFEQSLKELMQTVLKLEEEGYRRELDARPRAVYPAHIGMFLAMGILIAVPFVLKIGGLVQSL